MKFRLSERDKNSIFALLSIATILFVFTIMFFPELIEYEYSISKLAGKNDSVKSAIVQLSNDENRISKLKSEIEIKLEEVRDSNVLVEDMDSILSVEDFKLHIPSLFVTLEDKALARKLELTIIYDNFSIDGSNPKVISNPDMQEALDTIEEINEVIEGQIIEETNTIPIEDTTTTQPTGIVPSQDTNQVPVDAIDPSQDTNQVPVDAIEPIIEEDTFGISYASVPIIIRGEFLNVRDFIRALDELDFVEVSKIDILSKGSNVEASILLNIYYGEGDIR